MELIDVLVSRRLQRELRRRDAALRKAAEVTQAAEPKPEPQVAQREGVEVAQAAEPKPKPEPLVVQYASTARGWWECEYCGRGFHGYGQFLNHNCHEDG